MKLSLISGRLLGSCTVETFVIVSGYTEIKRSRRTRTGGNMGRYDEIFQRSVTDPEAFWGEAAGNISWYKKWDKVLDDSNKPFYRWFTGGELNTCYNAVDRHVEAGRGDQTAIIYDSPVTKQVRKITYKELLEQVSRFAGVLKGLGVLKGDTVVIYMPMVPAGCCGDACLRKTRGYTFRCLRRLCSP